MERSRSARRERVRSRRKQVAPVRRRGPRRSRGHRRPRRGRALRRRGTSARAGRPRPRHLGRGDARARPRVERGHADTRRGPQRHRQDAARGRTRAQLRGLRREVDGRDHDRRRPGRPRGRRSRRHRGRSLSQGEQVTAHAGCGRQEAALARSSSCSTPVTRRRRTRRPNRSGPESRRLKEAATAGASGVATKRQECQVALEIALRVKTRLEAARHPGAA